MKYMSIHDAAAKWHISGRRVQKLCKENRITGTTKFSHVWVIPAEAEKPADKRRKKM